MRVGDPVLVALRGRSLTGRVTELPVYSKEFRADVLGVKFPRTPMSVQVPVSAIEAVGLAPEPKS